MELRDNYTTKSLRNWHSTLMLLSLRDTASEKIAIACSQWLASYYKAYLHLNNTLLEKASNCMINTMTVEKTKISSMNVLMNTFVSLSKFI